MTYSLVSFDTNIFIYHIQGHPIFGKKSKDLISKLDTNDLKAVTSIVSQIELLSVKLPEQDLNTLKNIFLKIPNLQVIGVTTEVADQAAWIRRQYNFRLPDAIQLATAMCFQADIFISADKRLLQFSEIPIQIIE